MKSYIQTLSGPLGERRPPALAYDEMVTGQGAIRPHWQTLFAVLSELGVSGVGARAERVRQQLEDDGITFNLYDPVETRRGRGAAGVLSRPWALDPLPVIIGAAEWAVIEQGVAQRARLFDRLLADFYGPQTLLAQRRYPAGLVFGSDEFLRPCRSAQGAAPTRQLQHFAADLARGPDGVWRVVADRAQAPAGAAFAMQHRQVMSRVMSEAFRATRVRPLAGFFESWAADLQSRAADDRENPRLVLLTPGPYNEAYVEHVLLARELGATLVEGADLTSRDGRVFLKTLGGLVPVDVILRRVDGAWCDPLELRAESGLGVVGLVDAVRAGGVVVANAIGSGLVDVPALGAFLPGLAEDLLGEDLLLPSIATWWCGQPYALDDVIGRLDSLALRPALVPGGNTINAGELDARARGVLIERLRARPGAFVAQERIIASVAPGHGAMGLEPQSFVLRVFVTADRGDYVVMPGGLARVPSGNDPLRTGMQRGAVNKDVWVLADDPAGSALAPRAGTRLVTIRRTIGELPSRSADDLYWLGRNVERLDDGGRLLRAGLQRAVGGLTGARDFVEMSTINRVLARCGIVDLSVAAAPPDGPLVRHALVHAFASGRVLAGALATIERLAGAARDRFSADLRRSFNHLTMDLRDRLDRVGSDVDRMLELLDELVRVCAALAGFASENMTRGSGWRFLDLGRRIERGIYVSRVVLGVTSVPSASWDGALRLALELCDSSITYRTRYLAAMQDDAVLDLVIVDPTNPQSLGFQVARARAHLEAMPNADGDAGDAHEALRLLEGIIERLADMPGQLTADSVARLRGEIESAEAALMTLSDDLTRKYFSHVPRMRVFGAA